APISVRRIDKNAKAALGTGARGDEQLLLEIDVPAVQAMTHQRPATGNRHGLAVRVLHDVRSRGCVVPGPKLVAARATTEGGQPSNLEGNQHTGRTRRAAYIERVPGL